MTALQQVTAVQKQIEQYQTQLQQYENMLQNTLAPAAYIWDQAQTTIDRLIAAQNTLAYYESQLGSLDRYLSKFQDIAYYRSSPCFNGSGGCTPAEEAAMAENRRLASESQKKANEALFQTISDQQKALRNDARTLERLQGAAQGASGQLQAIGYANQLASQQAHQLLQIRTESTGGRSDAGTAGSSPFAQAAGFGGGDSGSGGGGLARAAKLAAGTIGELAKGAGAAVKQSAQQRVSETAGGKLAASIRASMEPPKADGTDATTFDGDSLGGADNASSGGGWINQTGGFGNLSEADQAKARNPMLNGRPKVKAIHSASRTMFRMFRNGSRSAILKLMPS